MIRTLYSLKLNPITNKVSSNFSKQKWNNIQVIIKRRYSSDNTSPPPPDPTKKLIIIACSLGMFNAYIRINKPEKNE